VATLVVAEVADGVERHGAPGGGGIDVHGGMADQQGVAVGGLLGDVVGADQAPGARLVFHHHGLSQRLRQVGRHQARHHIDQPAGRELRLESAV